MNLRMPLYVCVASTILAGAPAASTDAYRNEDYGIGAELPTGFTVCTTPPPGSNHGFVVLLLPGSCADPEPRHDWLSVFIAYNALPDIVDTYARARVDCRGAPVTQHGFTAAGHAFDTCEPKVAGGRQFTYVLLRKDRGTWPGDWVEVEVTIDYTDPRRLPTYRAIAERVMRSFVFW